MTPEELETLIEDATYDHAVGKDVEAIEKLDRATTADPKCFEAWHALAEINFAHRNFDRALAAAEAAHALRPNDLFINTTLSRVWMEKGNKPKAEHFGAQARMQSWKEELKQPPPDQAV
jgi:cytochrome c-type biogenesis protein CcmH/NrfG